MTTKFDTNLRKIFVEFMNAVTFKLNHDIKILNNIRYNYVIIMTKLTGLYNYFFHNILSFRLNAALDNRTSPLYLHVKFFYLSKKKSRKFFLLYVTFFFFFCTQVLFSVSEITFLGT